MLNLPKERQVRPIKKRYCKFYYTINSAQENKIMPIAFVAWRSGSRHRGATAGVGELQPPPPPP